MVYKSQYLEEFIKPYKNRGYNFHIESLQSKSINFDLIPVCYINSPKSIESFFQADEEGTANQPTAGFATDIQAVGSAGGTPEDFARVVTDFNPNTSLNIKAETDVGIFANKSNSKRDGGRSRGEKGFWKKLIRTLLKIKKELF